MVLTFLIVTRIPYQITTTNQWILNHAQQQLLTGTHRIILLT